MIRTPVGWANLVSRRQLEMWREEWASMEEDTQRYRLNSFKENRLRYLDIIHRKNA